MFVIEYTKTPKFTWTEYPWANSFKFCNDSWVEIRYKNFPEFIQQGNMERLSKIILNNLKQ